MFSSSEEDLTISCTRGDVGTFGVGATVGKGENKSRYVFRSGDVVRFTVCEKKNYSNVVLQKNFNAIEGSETVEIHLTGEDTKFGGIISKPVDYWYEIELNPDTNPQTIIGHNDDGAKVFKLFPEGGAVSE